MPLIPQASADLASCKSEVQQLLKTIELLRQEIYEISNETKAVSMNAKEIEYLCSEQNWSQYYAKSLSELKRKQSDVAKSIKFHNHLIRSVSNQHVNQSVISESVLLSNSIRAIMTDVARVGVDLNVIESSQTETTILNNQSDHYIWKNSNEYISSNEKDETIHFSPREKFQVAVVNRRKAIRDIWSKFGQILRTAQSSKSSQTSTLTTTSATQRDFQGFIHATTRHLCISSETEMSSWSHVERCVRINSELPTNFNSTLKSIQPCASMQTILEKRTEWSKYDSSTLNNILNCPIPPLSFESDNPGSNKISSSALNIHTSTPSRTIRLSPYQKKSPLSSPSTTEPKSPQKRDSLGEYHQSETDYHLPLITPLPPNATHTNQPYSQLAAATASESKSPIRGNLESHRTLQGGLSKFSDQSSVHHLAANDSPSTPKSSRTYQDEAYDVLVKFYTIEPNITTRKSPEETKKLIHKYSSRDDIIKLFKRMYEKYGSSFSKYLTETYEGLVTGKSIPLTKSRSGSTSAVPVNAIGSDVVDASISLSQAQSLFDNSKGNDKKSIETIPQVTSAVKVVSLFPSTSNSSNQKSNSQRTSPLTVTTAAIPSTLNPVERIASRIREIYTTHNITKINEVDALLEKYRGSEADLLARIEKKYRIPPLAQDSSSIDTSSAAQSNLASPASPIAATLFGSNNNSKSAVNTFGVNQKSLSVTSPFASSNLNQSQGLQSGTSKLGIELGQTANPTPFSSSHDHPDPSTPATSSISNTNSVSTLLKQASPSSGSYSNPTPFSNAKNTQQHSTGGGVFGRQQGSSVNTVSGLFASNTGTSNGKNSPFSNLSQSPFSKNAQPSPKSTLNFQAQTPSSTASGSSLFQSQSKISNLSPTPFSSSNANNIVSGLNTSSLNAGTMGMNDIAMMNSQNMGSFQAVTANSFPSHQPSGSSLFGSKQPTGPSISNLSSPLSIQEIALKLRNVYEQHEPTKIEKIPYLLEKYKGREMKLLGEVEAKYLTGLKHTDISNGAGFGSMTSIRPSTSFGAANNLNIPGRNVGGMTPFNNTTPSPFAHKSAGGIGSGASVFGQQNSSPWGNNINTIGNSGSTMSSSMVGGRGVGGWPTTASNNSVFTNQGSGMSPTPFGNARF